MVSVSEELIDRMAQRIVREVDPERVILFGSWARGEASKQSDVDFLVVECEPFGPDRSRREEAVRIWRCLSEFRVPTDILVYSQDEFETWEKSVNHIVARAAREGRLVYERS